VAQNQKHFEEFEPHTLLKHTVLRAYLQTWARKMLLRPGATRELCIVDACAGAGRDEQGNPESPVLAADVAKDAERHLQSDPELRKRFHGPLRIDLVAIEKEAKHYRRLVENLKPYENRARPLRGTLADYIEDHFSLYRDTPTLFSSIRSVWPLYRRR
jgi:three-Cys-motif partner protein